MMCVSRERGLSMNSREQDREVRRLAAERGWGEWPDDPRTLMIFLLLDARESARSHLLTAIQGLQHDLERLEKMLRNPSPILNNLGELQGRPPMVEAAVGEFCAADKDLRTYLETFPAKGE
jgi:hypothetical protein